MLDRLRQPSISTFVRFVKARVYNIFTLMKKMDGQTDQTATCPTQNI